MIKHVHDPFGSLVMIENLICNSEGVIKDISHFKDDIVRIIKRPAMLFEAFDITLNRYYFGAFDWDHPLLVVVRNKNRVWVIKEYFENPSTQLISNLFRSGNQLI